MIEIPEHHGEYETLDIPNFGEYPLKTGDYKVQVAWVDLDDEDPTWEPVGVVFKDVSKFIVRKLKQVRLPKRIKKALRVMG